jgi:hypothetical protein
MLGAGAVFGTGMAAFRYTAGLRGTTSGEVDEEEIERREAMKKMRRRPLSETLDQLGEGRGKCSLMSQSRPIVDNSRYLRPRIRGEEATEDPGEVRHGRKGGLDATRNFLEVYTRSETPTLKNRAFHSTCTYGLSLKSKTITSTSSTRIVLSCCALNK